MTVVVDNEDCRCLMVAAVLNGCEDGRWQGGCEAAGANRKTQTQQSNRGVGGGGWWQKSAVATGGYVDRRQGQAVTVACGSSGDRWLRW